jgi:NADPH:quinone reductase-like Zn-dependent oxidoreductase
VYERYGPPEVLQLREVDKPSPKANEVLVKVHATTVSIGDIKLRKPDPFAVRLFNGLLKPSRVKVLGMELAGEVEAAGRQVSRLRPGDSVFALTGFAFGGYAEYKCLPEEGTAARGGIVARKPANLTFEEAAAVPGGGITALVTLRKATIRQGSEVLIYGASGAVGTAAVQIAKALGANVTGVCSSANLDLVRSLGADDVIDYTERDFSEEGRLFDVVFDAVDKLSRSRAKRALKETGVHLNVVRDSGDGKGIGTEDLLYLKGLAEGGELRAVIDRRYTLSEIPDAHRYVEAGHKRGNVVVTVDGAGS